jgi:hypothetical protein
MTTECSDSNSESAARFERDAIALLDDLYGAPRRLIFTPFVKDRVCPHGCIASCTTWISNHRQSQGRPTEHLSADITDRQQETRRPDRADE